MHAEQDAGPGQDSVDDGDHGPPLTCLSCSQPARRTCRLLLTRSFWEKKNWEGGRRGGKVRGARASPGAQSTMILLAFRSGRWLDFMHHFGGGFLANLTLDCMCCRRQNGTVFQCGGKITRLPSPGPAALETLWLPPGTRSFRVGSE